MLSAQELTFEALIGNCPLTSSRLNGLCWKLCQMKCPVHELQYITDHSAKILQNHVVHFLAHTQHSSLRKCFDFFPSFARNFFTERSSKSLVFIVDSRAIALAILPLPALTSHGFVNVSATGQDMSQPARARYVCIFKVLGRVNISGHWRP